MESGICDTFDFINVPQFTRDEMESCVHHYVADKWIIKGGAVNLDN